IGRNYEIEAYFVLRGNSWTITEGDHNGNGYIEWSLNGTNYFPFSQPLTVADGTTAYIMAIGTGQYTFSMWDSASDLNGAVNPYEILSVEQNYVATAIFVTGMTYKISEGEHTGTGHIEWFDGVNWNAIPAEGLTISAGDNVLLMAVGASDNDIFSSWKYDQANGIGGNGNPHHIESVEKDYVIAAIFVLRGNLWTITEGDHNGNGYIEWSLNGTNYFPFSQPLTVADGTTIYIKAEGDKGYVFSVWTNGLTGNKSQCDLTVTEDRTIAARFVDGTAAHAITEGKHTGTGHLMWSFNDADYYLFSGPLTVAYEDRVYIKAESDGYIFSVWIGGITGNKNPCEIMSVKQDYVITAYFVKEGNSWTMTEGDHEGDGYLMWSFNDADYHLFSGTLTVADGDKIYIKAFGKDGNVFSVWANNTKGISGNKNPYEILSVKQDYVIEAYFVDGSIGESWAISDGDHDGEGHIEWSLNGTNYFVFSGPLTVAHGTTVYIRAVAAEGYEFSSWIYNGTESIGGNKNPYTITSVVQGHVIEAYFVDGITEGASWTISEGGHTGHGHIMWSLNGTDYFVFSGPLTVGGGDQVFLTAAGIDGDVFSSWIFNETTGIGGNANSYRIGSVEHDYIIKAYFVDGITEGASWTITEGDHDGNGHIEWSLNGTDYFVFSGPLTVADGDKVYIRSVADNMYTFDSWISGISGNADPYLIDSVNQDYVIGAAFLEIKVYFTLTSSVGGSGKIQYREAGSRAWSDLPASWMFESGTVLELQAVAGTGYGLFIWTGDLSGRSPNGSLTMDVDKDIGAVFGDHSVTVMAEEGRSFSYTVTMDGVIVWSDSFMADGAAAYVIAHLPYGVVLEISAEPEDGYTVHWNIPGQEQTAGPIFLYVVKENIEITVTFVFEVKEDDGLVTLVMLVLMFLAMISTILAMMARNGSVTVTISFEGKGLEGVAVEYRIDGNAGRQATTDQNGVLKIKASRGHEAEITSVTKDGLAVSGNLPGPTVIEKGATEITIAMEKE
ncbi:MAG: hypothetical protein LBV13_01885, partial [Methanomassiliicoccaceae archaeon]|nr:hypothetical protein [Methanomassiliicoccaceae archaeon]